MDGSQMPGAAKDAAAAGEPEEPASPASKEEAGPRPSLLKRLLRLATGGAPDVADAGDPRDAASIIAEQRLFANLLRMRDQRVEDIMIPRADIVAAPETISLDDLVAVFRDASLSRVPIYRETLDDPVGFAHLKDIAFACGFNGADSRAAFDLQRHLRPLLYVPPSMPTAKLLERMQASRKHIALIIDEYGGVDGLVTIEDLVEQIVGDIEDEHDTEEEDDIRELGEGRYAIRALTPIEDFNERFGTRFSDEEFDTVGGLVMQRFGHLPGRGEHAELGGWRFTVLNADNRRIRLLEASPSDEPLAAEQE